jgi:hypothetical protein
MQQTKNTLIATYNQHKNALTNAEILYFTRSFKLSHKIPTFYGLPKIHKTPMKLRPIISCINSFSSILSKWLDLKMKELLNLGIFSSYIKNSSSLINDTSTLFIPTGAKLFTAKASSMYTNIDSTSGIQAFQTLFTTYNHLIPQTFFLCLATPSGYKIVVQPWVHPQPPYMPQLLTEYMKISTS